MNDKLIKQIKELNGVETVETFSDKSDKVVVTFEAEKVAVECTNSEQCKFIHIQNSWEHNPIHNSIDGSIFLRLTHMGWDSRREYCNKDGNTIISFTQYLKDYNLQDEWGKYFIGEAEKRGFVEGAKYLSPNIKIERVVEFPLYLSSNVCRICCKNGEVLYNGKWAEIIPDELELVKGEVYYDEDGTSSCIFRFKSQGSSNDVNHYSFYSVKNKNFFKNGHFCTNDIIPATDKQKRKLIKKEVNNGFFWELVKK